MRTRVRCEVMPMPASVAEFIAAGRASCANAPHLCAVGKVDLQRRDRYPAMLNRVEIGTLAGIRRRTGGTDPVQVSPRGLTDFTAGSALWRRPRRVTWMPRNSS
jgi:hypothetical protein